MNILLGLYFLINIALAYSQVTEEEVHRAKESYAQMMQHDGVKRVKVITKNNAQKLLDKHHLVVIMYWIDNKEEKEKINPKEMELLEVVAQIFKERSVVIGTMELKSNQAFAKVVGVRYTGMITIFNKKRLTVYSGQRSADVIIPYLSKQVKRNVVITNKNGKYELIDEMPNDMLIDKPVTTISSKSEKKAFDDNELAKVIAYMNKNTQEFKAFSDAALAFQPMTPFYAVHDPKVAKTFHLKKMNTIQFIKPFEKTLTYPSKKEITEKAIVKFIGENIRQRLTKLRVENLHDVWIGNFINRCLSLAQTPFFKSDGHPAAAWCLSVKAVDKTGYVVPIFANTKTEDGAKFFSLAKSLSKHYEKNPSLSFVWIDPSPFPSMIAYWRDSFGINPLKPIFGVVDVHKQNSAWYDTVDEEGEYVFVLSSMKKWLNNVLNENIELKQINPARHTETSPNTPETKEEL